MIKKMVFAYVLVTMFMLPGTLFASGQNEKGDGKIKIGAAMADSSDKWFSYLEEGVKAFANEMPNVEVIMTDGKSDAAIQLNSIETLLVLGIQALVIVPVDISAMTPIVAACKEANVPLVVVNRLPAEEIMNGDNIYYVGPESIQAGILQAEWVVKTLGEAGKAGGNVGIITGKSGHEGTIMRTQGNRLVFENTDFDIAFEAEGKFDRALGMKVAENWFQAGNNLVAILANNDEMAIGAILAAKGEGIPDEDIIIAGIDATPDAVEYIGKGLDVTVFQSAEGQGYDSMEVAYKVIKGETVEKTIWIPYVIVTAENKDEFI